MHLTRPAFRQCRIVQVTTIPDSLFFLRGQAAFMKSQGYEVHAVSSPGPRLDEFARTEGVTTHAVVMHRSISPFADVRALWQLVGLLRQLRPEILHVLTPKAALLAGLAGWLARVPVRIYHLLGLPIETATGLRRWLLLVSDWVACRVSHRVLCISFSLQDLAVASRIVPSGKTRVLLAGGVTGVDSKGRFNPVRWRDHAQSLRKTLGIPDQSQVIGYIGRIVRDKGLIDLAEAWSLLRGSHSDLHLLIVGDEETQDPVPKDVMLALRSDPRVHIVPHTGEPAPYFALLDVFVFPSHREGFGLVALEAAAMEVPVVATQITGIRDAVQDGTTGILVPRQDVESLHTAVASYLDDPALRERHGKAGRRRAQGLFDPEAMSLALLGQYIELSQRSLAL